MSSLTLTGKAFDSNEPSEGVIPLPSGTEIRCSTPLNGIKQAIAYPVWSGGEQHLHIGLEPKSGQGYHIQVALMDNDQKEGMQGISLLFDQQRVNKFLSDCDHIQWKYWVKLKKTAIFVGSAPNSAPFERGKNIIRIFTEGDLQQHPRWIASIFFLEKAKNMAELPF